MTKVYIGLGLVSIGILYIFFVVRFKFNELKREGIL